LRATNTSNLGASAISFVPLAKGIAISSSVYDIPCSLRLPVWPCQVVATCQRVTPFAGSSLTLSISENRSSTLMPLTTFGAVVIALPSMTDLLYLAWVGGKCATGSVQCGEGCLNSLTLGFGDQTVEHLAEIRMPSAGVDVLPAIGRKKGGLDRPRLVCPHVRPQLATK